MPLYVFNLTVNPVVLAVVTPAKTIPASAVAGQRGAPVNVTTDLRGLSSGDYVTLQAQVTAGLLHYEWTNGYQEYATNALAVLSQPTGIMESPEPAVDTQYTIYVRTTGSDSTGDGSVAAPYRTYVRARKDIPTYVPAHAFYKIDITGIDEVMPIGYSEPPVFKSSDQYYEPFTMRAIYGYIRTILVSADPNPILTITSEQIVSQALDPVIDAILKVTTNLAMTPNAYKGKIIYGASPYQYGIITSNTATEIETTKSHGTFTAPITIADYGAILRNEGGVTDYFSTISITACSAEFTFAGIKFKNSRAANNQPALSSVGTAASSGKLVTFNLCEFESYYAAEGSQQSAHDCHFLYNTEISGRYAGYNTMGFFEGGTPYFPSGTAYIYDSVFDGAAVCIGGLDIPMYHYTGNATCRIAHNIVRNSPAGNTGGHGLLLVGVTRGAIYQLRCDNCAGSAIAIDGPGHVVIRADLMAGSGNTRYGLELTSGAQVYLTEGAGALHGNMGDVKCGSLAVKTWAEYVAAGRVLNDLAAADPQMCRCSNAYGVS